MDERPGNSGNHYLGQPPDVFSSPAFTNQWLQPVAPGSRDLVPYHHYTVSASYHSLPQDALKREGHAEPSSSMLDSTAAPHRAPAPKHQPPPSQQHSPDPRHYKAFNSSGSPDNNSGNMKSSGNIKSTSSSATSASVTTSPDDVNHLLNAVNTEMLAGSENGDPTEKHLTVTLEDKDLWLRFKEFTNEMIVTKTGRRMFPVFRCSVTGLSPLNMYTLLLDFVQVDSHRWKYVNGDWVAGGKAEPAAPNCVYIHPDSPNFGSHWMKEAVSFSKVKLTNKMNGGGQIMLNSLHKYEPRLHIIKVDRGNGENKELHTFSFNETQFIAVTAYQNEEITALKIKYNPFAKAFLDAKERPDQRDLIDDGTCDGQGRALSHFPGAWYLPTGGHSLVPPPAHQFTSHLGLSNTGADRLALRNSRPSPYPAYTRRSPPHSSNYSRDMSNLSMFNLPEQWPNMAGMGTQGLLTGGSTGSVGMGQSMGGQYPSMWMSSAVSNLGNVSQSCAMPYLRSGGPGAYSLPPVTAPPAVSSPSSGLGGALQTVSSGVPGQCEQPYDLGAYSTTAVVRDHSRPNAPTWNLSPHL